MDALPLAARTDPATRRAARRPAVLPLWPPAALGEFARQQALSCVFPLAIFAALAASRTLPLPDWLPRYDFLLLWCLAVQWGMVAGRLETRDELKVICVFHVLGLALELFKTHAGSWSYPEFAYSKVAGAVPLYSGFMYASVASYLCQAWRRLGIRLCRFPDARLGVGLAAAIYVNFFTHHALLPDLRLPLALGVLAAFHRATARYEVRGRVYHMPLVLGFLLVGLFVYFAENLTTYFGAWVYPNQASGWRVVHLGKIGSWSLLVILTFLLVAFLKRVKAGRLHSPPARITLTARYPTIEDDDARGQHIREDRSGRRHGRCDLRGRPRDRVPGRQPAGAGPRAGHPEEGGDERAGPGGG